MGIDVGFSKTRRTTGIACLDGDKLYLSRAGTSRESRVGQIPADFQADVIALDGPLLPRGVSGLVRRQCECIFIHAPFSKRCKPGLSDFGFGLKLRRATKSAYEDVRTFLADSTRPTHERFGGSDDRIIEAFPNAFLAVLLPEKEFRSTSRPKRRRRYDWLYERAVRTETLKSALSKVVDLPDVVWHQMTTEKDHEKRAALVCLLTAALKAKDKAYRVGDAEGGGFWLPPWSQWQAWARDGLSAATDRCTE